MDKKILLVVFILIIIVVITTMIIRNNKGDSSGDNNEKSKIVIDGMEIYDITKKFENGITSVNACVKSNLKTSANLKIILKDNTGKEVASIIHIVEGLVPEKEKKISAGITGDYSQIEDIEFVVISDEKINEYNK